MSVLHLPSSLRWSSCNILQGPEPWQNLAFKLFSESSSSRRVQLYRSRRWLVSREMMSLRAVGGVLKSLVPATSYRSRLPRQHQLFSLSCTTRSLSLSGVREDEEKGLPDSERGSHTSPRPVKTFFTSILLNSPQTFVRLRFSSHPDCVLSRIGVRFFRYPVSQIFCSAPSLSHGTPRYTSFNR